MRGSGASAVRSVIRHAAHSMVITLMTTGVTSRGELPNLPNISPRTDLRSLWCDAMAPGQAKWALMVMELVCDSGPSLFFPEPSWRPRGDGWWQVSDVIMSSYDQGARWHRPDHIQTNNIYNDPSLATNYPAISEPQTPYFPAPAWFISIKLIIAGC